MPSSRPRSPIRRGLSLASKPRADGIPRISIAGSTAADHSLDTLGREVCDVAYGAVGSLNYHVLFETVNVGLAIRSLETFELADISQYCLDTLDIDRQSVIDTSSLYVTADIAGYDAECALCEVEIVRREGRAAST